MKSKKSSPFRMTETIAPYMLLSLYTVIHRQTVPLYHKTSMRLDASNWNWKPADFTSVGHLTSELSSSLSKRRNLLNIYSYTLISYRSAEFMRRALHLHICGSRQFFTWVLKPQDCSPKVCFSVICHAAQPDGSFQYYNCMWTISWTTKFTKLIYTASSPPFCYHRKDDLYTVTALQVSVFFFWRYKMSIKSQEWKSTLYALKLRFWTIDSTNLVIWPRNIWSWRSWY